MKFEYLYLDEDTIKSIFDFNISNLDKLFLKICTINTYFDFHLDYLKQLQKLDISKVVLVLDPFLIGISNENLQKEYVAITEWPGLCIKYNSNYVYQNYNFISLNNIAMLPINLIHNKINIVLQSRLCNVNQINDQLRLLDCQIYIDITIRPKSPKSCRYLLFVNGILRISNIHSTFTNTQYIQLIDNKVHLKPPAIYI